MNREWQLILDGTVAIDSNSEKALKFKEKCENVDNHPSDVIIEVYGSFKEMYDSGDIRIDFRKVFSEK